MPLRTRISRWLDAKRARQAELIRRRYGDDGPRRLRVIDEKLDRRVSRYVGADCVLMDAGCGRLTRWPETKRLCKSVVGVDASPDIKTNLLVTDPVMGDLESLPLTDQSVDLIVCFGVFEHLGRPSLAVQELYRVLRPGGRLVVRTPNRFSYHSVVAQIVPNRFHPLFTKLIYSRPKEDTFPTRFRANTPAKLRKLFRGGGFRVDRELLIECEPPFVVFDWVLRLLMAWEGLLNSSRRLAGLRAILVYIVERPAETSAGAQARPAAGVGT